MKKDKSHGTNGTVNAGASQGRLLRGNGGFSANHRNKRINLFGGASHGRGQSFNNIDFQSVLNGIFQEEINDSESEFSDYNYRLGLDYFISEKSTIGFLTNFSTADRNVLGNNTISLSQNDNRTVVDSILVALSNSETSNQNATFNVNYRFDDRDAQRSLNVDLDYGTYKRDATRFLPNEYFDASGENLLTTVINLSLIHISEPTRPY